MDVVNPLQNISTLEYGLVSPRVPTEGTAIGAESGSAVFNSAIRIPQGIIELSSRIHKKYVKVLVDSGSTGNYISDQIVRDFNLIVKKEEGYEELTLADGSKVKA